MRATAIRTILLLVLALPLSARTVQAQERPFFRSPSGWLSGDKPRHFAASGTATVLSTAVLDQVGFDGTTALLLGVSATTAAGMAKEWLDYREGRFADPKDIVWNAIGTAAGAALVRLVRPPARSIPGPVPAPARVHDAPQPLAPSR